MYGNFIHLPFLNKRKRYGNDMTRSVQFQIFALQSGQFADVLWAKPFQFCGSEGTHGSIQQRGGALIGVVQLLNIGQILQSQLKSKAIFVILQSNFLTGALIHTTANAALADDIIKILHVNIQFFHQREDFGVKSRVHYGKVVIRQLRYVPCAAAAYILKIRRKKDGLMPLLLNLQRYAQPYMKEMGEDHYIVATRGPLTIASHLLELTELLVAIKTEPDSAHALLRKTTDLCKLWLEAQLDNVKTAKGILVLDDPTGFLEEDDYLEFSHPYIKEIFSAFPEAIHIFHNDAVRTASYPHLEDMGVDLFNFTHTVDIGEAKKLLGPNVCMLGNVPPMALAKQSPEEVYTLTQDCISRYIEANNGSFRGLIVSPGGGMPMGATHENTRALIKAVKTFGL